MKCSGSRGSSRMQSNLLQQNCFVRDVCRKVDLKSVNSETTYDSIDEKVTDKGLEIEHNSYPYPITPQYVNSFVDSSDYRRDPANAIANGVKRQNLGDISAVQQVFKMDTVTARALFAELSKKFSVQSQTAPAVSTNIVKEDKPNG